MPGSVAHGFYCHGEMFVWARNLMDRTPNITQIIRDRFPILLLDEAQDNSEEQSAILHRIFLSHANPVVRNALGTATKLSSIALTVPMRPPIGFQMAQS